MKQYIVDAFTQIPFAGNPAAVCVMEAWPAEDTMKKLAMENNLSETAFIVKEEPGYHLRWFTPTTEVELCGHGTLASSHVIFNYYEPEAQSISFDTMSGRLTVEKEGDLYVMNFPTYELTEIPVTDDMEKAFGVRPVKAYLGMDLLCVFEKEEDIRTMQEDQLLVEKLPGRLQNVTAKGKDYDCVSRTFCPKVGIAEDPVCGSAHTHIAAYWAKELHQDTIFAYQASRRGGELTCQMLPEGRMALKGNAITVAVSELLVDLYK